MENMTLFSFENNSPAEMNQNQSEIDPPPNESNNGKKRTWTMEEDEMLMNYVKKYGARNWHKVSAVVGLQKSGKSCRSRWVTKLDPSLKQGPLSGEEERLVLELQALHGNKWTLIAKHLPGRTDNDVKNNWHKQMHRLQREVQSSSAVDNLPMNNSNFSTAMELDSGMHFHGYDQNYEHAFQQVPEGGLYLDGAAYHAANCFIMERSIGSQINADEIPSLQNAYPRLELDRVVEPTATGSEAELDQVQHFHNYQDHQDTFQGVFAGQWYHDDVIPDESTFFMPGFSEESQVSSCELSSLQNAYQQLDSDQLVEQPMPQSVEEGSLNSGTQPIDSQEEAGNAVNIDWDDVLAWLESPSIYEPNSCQASGSNPSDVSWRTS